MIPWILGIAGGTVLLGLGVFTFWATTLHRRFHHYHRRVGRAAPRPADGWLGFYLRVLVAVCRLSWWTVRSASVRWQQEAGSGTASPVLCVHGFGMTPTCFHGLRRELERRGHSTHAVYLGPPSRGADAYAQPLEDALERLSGSSDVPIDVVAHSMGGIVTRHVLGKRPDLGARLGRLVTLGTPHHGTEVLRDLHLSRPVVEMMAPGCDYLQQLPEPRVSAPSVDVVTVAAGLDTIVYPPENALLDGTRRITVPDAGHTELLTRPDLNRLVADLLAAN